MFSSALKLAGLPYADIGSEFNHAVQHKLIKNPSYSMQATRLFDIIFFLHLVNGLHTKTLRR